MKSLVTAAVLAITLSGCATSLVEPVSITADERARFESSGTVTVSMYETPGFLFNTPTGALVSSGMAAWKDSSNAPSWGGIRSEHGIADFTDTVRKKFVAELANQSTATAFSTADTRQPLTNKEETAYVKQFPTEYVLEVRSLYGSFHYGPLSWKTYMLNYSGLSRLIRTSDEAVVWKGTCQVKASSNDILKVPYEDFMGGNGEKVRAAAAFATDSCVSQLVASYSASL